MRTLELYHEYRREEAIALVGAGKEGRSLRNGQWVLFSNAALCFATMRSAPDVRSRLPDYRSHFPHASFFYWMDERMREEGWKREAPPPSEPVRRIGGDLPPTLVFLNTPGSETYIFAGEFVAAYETPLEGSYGRHNSFRPPVPSDVLVKLGCLPPVSTPDDALDADLRSLSETTSTERRLEILERVIAYWNGPRVPADGLPPTVLEGKRLPHPLRWWLLRYGDHPGVLLAPNHLPELEQLEPEEGGKLVFLIETQGVWLWATEAEGDDPPVWGRMNEEDEPWVQVSTSLSEFLLATTLYQSMRQSLYHSGNHSVIFRPEMDRIMSALPPYPLAGWCCYGPGCRGQFYGRDGAFMFVSDDGVCDGEQSFGVEVAARTERPLLFLKELREVEWWPASF